VASERWQPTEANQQEIDHSVTDLGQKDRHDKSSEQKVLASPQLQL
jgi:hypothetical protein